MIIPDIPDGSDIRRGGLRRYSELDAVYINPPDAVQDDWLLMVEYAAFADDDCTKLVNADPFEDDDEWREISREEYIAKLKERWEEFQMSTFREILF